MSDKKVKSKVTLEKLAAMMTNGFAQAKKDNEDLAVMVKQGFDEVDRRFGKVDKHFTLRSLPQSSS